MGRPLFPLWSSRSEGGFPPPPSILAWPDGGFQRCRFNVLIPPFTEHDDCFRDSTSFLFPCPPRFSFPLTGVGTPLPFEILWISVCRALCLLGPTRIRCPICHANSASPRPRVIVAGRSFFFFPFNQGLLGALFLLLLDRPVSGTRSTFSSFYSPVSHSLYSPLIFLPPFCPGL